MFCREHQSNSSIITKTRTPTNARTHRYASAVHGVLSDPAIDRINKSPIKEFIVTDTIPMDENEKKCSKMRVLSVAPLLAEAVKRIHMGGSLSNLFRDVPGKDSTEAGGKWSLD